MPMDTDGWRLVQDKIAGLQAENERLRESPSVLRCKLKEALAILKEFVEGAGDSERWLFRCDAALERAQEFLEKEKDL